MVNRVKEILVRKMHIEISERKMVLHLFDVFFVLVSLYCIGFYFDVAYLKISVIDILCVSVLVAYVKVFGAIFEMYNLQVASNNLQVLKSAVLTAAATALFYFFTPLYSLDLHLNPFQIFTFFTAIFTSLLLWRLMYVKFLASNRFAKIALLVCEKEQADELIQGLEKIDPHYRVLAYINNPLNHHTIVGNHQFIDSNKTKDLVSYVKGNYVSEVVVANLKTEGISTELYQQLLRLLESGMVIREYNQVYENKTQRIPVNYVSRDFYRFFPFSKNNKCRFYISLVRVLEIVGSICGLLFGFMLLPFILAGNLLGNRGKLFYTQERVGKEGKKFNILKLRTMAKDAKCEDSVFTTANDSRVTAFGRFLRRTRIDEIPQFINVLRGEMAVIGPRPERPFIVKDLVKMMPFYETRHVIKPGLTGWAQVNYSYGETFEDSLTKLQYDLYYIKHRSIYLDFNIVVKTITTVLFYRGQ